MGDDRELRAMEMALDALQPLDMDEKQRILDWLASKLGLTVPTANATSLAGDEQGAGSSGGGSAGDLGTVKQFLALRRPPDDVTRATTLAYYLSHGKREASYTTAALTKARVDAAMASFNMSRAVSNARSAGYLTNAATRGTYQITSTGEALVEAMPNPALMKQVKQQGARRRRRSTGAKGSTATGATQQP